MSRLFVISVIVHVAVLAIVSFVPGLMRATDTALEVYTVELVELPRESRAAPPAAEPEREAEEPVAEREPEPEPKPEEAIPEEPVRRQRQVVVKPPPREERSLRDRIQDRLTDREEPVREKAPEVRTEPAAQPTGATKVTAARFPYAWYLSVVQGKVSANWRQPSARLLSDERLVTLISFRIRRNGSLEAVTLRDSSGRSTMDQSAVKAIRDSAPFPPLPDDYLESFLDITMDFSLTQER